jgi:hypothetical protein
VTREGSLHYYFCTTVVLESLKAVRDSIDLSAVSNQNIRATLVETEQVLFKPQHALASNRTLCDLTASLIVILYQHLHQSSRNHQSRWTTRLVTCYDVQQRNNSVLTELVAHCLRDAFSTCVSSITDLTSTRPRGS